MLITFSTPAHGDVTMFGDVAMTLIKMMGRSDTVPSALYAEDVQAALDQLKNALEPVRSKPEADMLTEDGDEEVAVSMSHRALPLIELLEAAVHEKCTVMWESNE